jgi:hypothetical protein
MLPAQEQHMAERPWTVLVWMAGESDRHDSGRQDLERLRAAGSSRGVTVLAQLERGEGGHTRRYRLRSDGELEGDVVQDLGPTDPGDPLVAADFLAWGLAAHPSRHVLAVLWNRPGHGKPHGAARHHRALFSSTVEKALLRRGMAQDDSRDFLDALQLGHVLAEVKRRSGRRIDVLGLDGGLMSSVEVAFQCRGQAALLVASEEPEPKGGWPYDRILRDLVSAPDLQPLGLARRIVDHAVAASRDAGATLSVLDVARAPALALAVDALAGALLRALREATEFVAFTRAINGTQALEAPHFLDLADLAGQLRERVKDPRVRAAAAEVQAALVHMIAAEGRRGPLLERAQGASIYFPRGGGSMVYEKLDFARSTRWAELIARYAA